MRLEALSQEAIWTLPHNALPLHSLTHASATATIVYAHIQMVTHKERRFGARARTRTQTNARTQKTQTRHMHAGI